MYKIILIYKFILCFLNHRNYFTRKETKSPQGSRGCFDRVSCVGQTVILPVLHRDLLPCSSSVLAFFISRIVPVRGIGNQWRACIYQCRTRRRRWGLLSISFPGTPPISSTSSRPSKPLSISGLSSPYVLFFEFSFPLFSVFSQHRRTCRFIAQVMVQFSRISSIVWSAWTFEVT